MARLLSDETLAQRLASQAIARVERDFRPENYRRSLLEIYREALS
jgi:glycosyltransferase involved in cell wall biosynthesis